MADGSSVEAPQPAPSESKNPTPKVSRRWALKSVLAAGAAFFTRRETAKAQSLFPVVEKPDTSEENPGTIDIALPNITSVPGYEPREANHNDNSVSSIPTPKEKWSEAEVPDSLRESAQTQVKAANILINKPARLKDLEVKLRYMPGAKTTARGTYTTAVHNKKQLYPELDVYYSKSDEISYRAIDLKVGAELGRMIILSYDDYLTGEFAKIISGELNIPQADLDSPKLPAEEMAKLQKMSPLFKLDTYNKELIGDDYIDPENWKVNWPASIYSLWVNQPNLAEKLSNLPEGLNTQAAKIFIQGLGLFTRMLPEGMSLKSIGIDRNEVNKVEKIIDRPAVNDSSLKKAA